MYNLLLTKVVQINFTKLGFERKDKIGMEEVLKHFRENWNDYKNCFSKY